MTRRHPTRPDLLALVDLSEMTGASLRAHRAALGRVTGKPVSQAALAAALGTRQTRVCEWETGRVVPARIAALVRLLLLRAEQEAVPASLRPERAVLSDLADLAENAAVAFGGDDSGGAAFRAVTAFALANAPAVTDWIAAFREATAPPAPPSP